MLTNDEAKNLMTQTESIVKTIYPKFDAALLADVVNTVVLQVLKNGFHEKLKGINLEVRLKRLVYEAVWYSNNCQSVPC